jgi:hypothetical protein
MAFSATVQNTVYLGAGLTKLSGTWSGSAGDAAGTMTVSGPVIKADFQKFDSDNTYQGLARVFSSITSGITTLTINNQDNVTTGYFTIEKLGQ